MRKIFLLFIAGLILLTGIACEKKGAEKAKPSPFLTAEEITAMQQKMAKLPAVPVTDNEIAVLETNLGTIEFELFPKVAPNHCASFKKLALNGYYDGTTFHRVVPGFVIQGGDILSRDSNPYNDGNGGPGYALNAEFSNISHKRGIVSTAREGNDINSGGSQFFICLADIPHLDGKYTVFGRVIKGMDVVDKIAQVVRDERDRPVQNVVMKHVTVQKR